MNTTKVTRLENFIAWVKILRPKYRVYWPWYAWENSRTHYADEELWPYGCKPIHKNKY